jgi:hypothetical protein
VGAVFFRVQHPSLRLSKGFLTVNTQAIFKDFRFTIDLLSNTPADRQIGTNSVQRMPFILGMGWLGRDRSNVFGKSADGP